MTEPLLFDTRHAAEYLGVSKRTIEAYIANGVFEIVRLPTPNGKRSMRKNFIRREELDRWVQSQAKHA